MKEYLEKLRTASEKELRDLDVVWPHTRGELESVINALAGREHDYGTCVYAMSIAALSAYYYMSSVLGVTGFQASCADLDFLKRARSLTNGFRLLDYDKLLYPQYLNEEHFPSIETLVEDKRSLLRNAAKEKLVKYPNAAPEVIARWKELARDDD